jgi:tetrahydromethanopterin S-methyltransferase subunit G
LTVTVALLEFSAGKDLSDIVGPSPDVTSHDHLERRLDAVERRLTDGELDERGLDDLPDRAALDERLREVESRLDAVEARLDDLDAATQAVRGYVGGVRAVNRDVERRADAALAAVDRLERKIGGADGAGDSDGRVGSDRPDVSRSIAPAPGESGDEAGSDGGDHTGEPESVEGEGSLAERLRDAL